MRIAALASAGVLLASAVPAQASYGGTPVEPAVGRVLVYLTSTLGSPTRYVLTECSGTLVGPRRVLTAAHCVRDRATGRPKTIVGRTAIVGTGSTGVERTVTGVWVHPRFTPRRAEAGHDIAVLRLDRPVARPPIALITPAEEAAAAAPPAHAVAAGYGITRPGMRPARRGARWVPQELVPMAACGGDAFGPAFVAVMQCASWPTAGVCPGDSGGPLLVSIPGGGRRVVGVVSQALLGVSCRKVVGVYMRVTPVGGWLRARLRG